jgi:hypothetical protein
MDYTNKIIFIRRTRYIKDKYNTGEYYKECVDERLKLPKRVRSAV